MTDREDKIEKRGGEWVVLAMSGREMGTYQTEAEARERLRQVEAAKAAKADDDAENQRLATADDAGAVIRVDRIVGEIHTDPERTDGALATVDPETGFLRVDARLTRTGVFTYSDAEGRTWGELRTDAEVFDADTLDSFRLAVVTDDHPDGFVTASTVRDVQIGSVGTDVRRDGEFVRATIQITDADAIKAIQGGKKELSCGYTARVIQDQGVAPGGATYAARQTQIRGNHVAVVNRGRAGPSCRILDTPGASRTTIQGIETMTDNPTPDTPREDTRAIQIGDESIEVAARVAAEIEKLRSDNMHAGHSEEEEDMDDKKKDADASALRAKVDALQAQLDEARASESARIDARVQLVTTARDILGPEAKTDGQTDAEIMRAAILAVSPSLAPRLDNNAGDLGYLRASFDAAVDLHRSRATAEADTMAALFATANPESKNDAADPDVLFAAYLDNLNTRKAKA